MPTGGHNPLEAARFGVPVAAGPSMENFHEIEDAFDAADAWLRVASAPELAECWKLCLEEPTACAAIGRRGRDVVDRNRGALAATLDGLLPLLHPTRVAP